MGSITIEIAREIRTSSETQKEVAARFGVHQSSVSLIRRGKTWVEEGVVELPRVRGTRATKTCSIEGCDGKLDARGWCAAHWARWKKYGDVFADKPIGWKPDPIEHFWAGVDQSGGEDACWPWMRGTWGGGYGSYRTDWSGRSKAWGTHTFAWTITNGTMPEGLQILHGCDNPPCCNPRHLRVGTNQDNMDDKVSKGRQSRLAGELNGFAKLTRESVVLIRSSDLSQRALARQLGVSKSTIARARRGECWREDADS